MSDEEKENDEETVDLRVLDPNIIDLDLNHGRIGKIENLEPLTQLGTSHVLLKHLGLIFNIATFLCPHPKYDK